MKKIYNENHDPMTECYYPMALENFDSGMKPKDVFVVPLIEEGLVALRKINKERDWNG